MSGAGGHARRQVFLHIGAMRSGTTFLQQVLGHRREELGTEGVLFPGQGQYARQVAAVRDILELPGSLPAAEFAGAWARLRAEIAAWDGGRSVVSVPQLSLARRGQVEAVVDSLAPAEVCIVLTARDLGRVLPSSWQETLQNGSTSSWPQYVAAVLDDVGAEARTADQRSWRQHDLLDIVRRWSAVVPAEQIQVVTVPPVGAAPKELWHRFCAAIGIDSVDHPVPDVRLETNRGLGRQAAEMLRELNLRLEDRLQPDEYVHCVKRPIARRALRRLPFAPIPLPTEHAARVLEKSEEVVTGLRGRGVKVVGDLRDLVPPVPPPADGEVHSARRSRLDAEQIATAATASAISLLKTLAHARTTTVAAQPDRHVV